MLRVSKAAALPLPHGSRKLNNQRRPRPAPAAALDLRASPKQIRAPRSFKCYFPSVPGVPPGVPT